MARSIWTIGVFVGYLGLFWTKACVGEILTSFLLYYFNMH
jgi:hypothetical protein